MRSVLAAHWICLLVGVAVAALACAVGGVYGAAVSGTPETK